MKKLLLIALLCATSCVTLSQASLRDFLENAPRDTFLSKKHEFVIKQFKLTCKSGATEGYQMASVPVHFDAARTKFMKDTDVYKSNDGQQSYYFGYFANDVITENTFICKYCKTLQKDGRLAEGKISFELTYTKTDDTDVTYQHVC